jgi:hypothetical protein
VLLEEMRVIFENGDGTYGGDVPTDVETPRRLG